VFGALKIVPLKWQECMLWEDSKGCKISISKKVIFERSTNLQFALSAALTHHECAFFSVTIEIVNNKYN
jgi:hypothetical protein